MYIRFAPYAALAVQHTHQCQYQPTVDTTVNMYCYITLIWCMLLHDPHCYVCYIIEHYVKSMHNNNYYYADIGSSLMYHACTCMGTSTLYLCIVLMGSLHATLTLLPEVMAFDWDHYHNDHKQHVSHTRHCGHHWRSQNCKQTNGHTTDIRQTISRPIFQDV